MHSILLAFDIGTSGLKASLVDENLNIIRNVTTTYPTHHYPDGGCEQESADWWMSAVRAMMMLRELAPEYVKRVDAIGVSGHMLGCLPMDKEGQTLRPAMIHADTRALTISNALRARFGRDYFYEICGNVLSPASTLCKTSQNSTPGHTASCNRRTILSTALPARWKRPTCLMRRTACS